MGHRGHRAVVTLFALATVVTACTSNEHGTPTPGSGGTSATDLPTTQTTTQTTTQPSTTIAHPVDLTGVNPCELFSSAVSVAAHTGGDDDVPRKTDVTSLPDATGCFQVDSKQNVGLTIATATSTDVGSYTTSQGMQVQQFTVRGYPAVVVPPPGVPACLGGIGMAEHQMVYLRYGLANPTSSPRVPQAELCARLRPIAEQLVAELTH